MGNELGSHRAIRNAFTPPGPYRLGFDGYWAGYNFSHNSYNGVYFEDTCAPIRYAGYEADTQTDMAMARLDHHAEADKPFALFLSWGPPHDPWGADNVKPDDWARFADADIPARPNVSETQDPYADKWATMDGRYREDLSNNVRGYYAQTTNIDWNLGRIVDKLEACGLAENTVLVFTSDHGEMFGSHGRRAKNIFYDEATHVPLLIRKPGLVREGAVDECFSTVDMMPTLLSLLDLPVPEKAEGVDVGPCLIGSRSAAENTVLMQGMGTTAAWRDGSEWRGLRNRQFTYAVYRLDRSEHLYDNVSDPFQMNNLATERSQVGLVEHFRNLLTEKLAHIGDTFKACTWYESAWTQDRNIMRGARGGSHDLSVLADTIATHFPDDALTRTVDDLS
jgi:arylsulfatase A-like enzyme